MNRIVIITGATSGFGLQAACKFKENGDIVIAASRNPEKVRRVINEYGFDDGFVIDVTDYDAWMELKAYVMGKYGRVDVLVNNAGSGVSIVDTVDQTRDTIDRTIATNLTSVIYGSQLFGEVMKAQGDGIIINLSSVCARHCWGGWSVYAAAKAGVLNFTKGLYVELQPYGVRATCIIPASVSTDFQKSAGIGEVEQSISPEDIANAVFYAANQPRGVVVEEMTVWGTSQIVEPL
ncbi:MAG: SDR family oxidoreductase [Ruminococcaceae bacterium]|nr:SDR family oxidoreductase [Oscillospiraceae bacterium]